MVFSSFLTNVLVLRRRILITLALFFNVEVASARLEPEGSSFFLWSYRNIRFVAAYLDFVAIAARRTCRNLSRLSLSRYSLLKSSLNLPLKLLICLITSFLPRPAIEAAKESKEFLEAIIISLENRFY